MANIQAKHGYGQFDSNNFIQEGLSSSSDIYQRWILDTKNKLLNVTPREDFIIPLETHVIWLTSDNNPAELNELYIRKYTSTCERLLAENKNFKFYLWTNNPKIVLPKKITDIPNFEIKSIYEFKDNTLWPEFDKLLKQSQTDPTVFAQTSDIARVMILVKDGGIYHDLDHEILNAKPLCQYMKSYHYINGKEHDFWDAIIGNAFTATVANHSIPRMEENLIKRNLDKTTKLPLYIKYPYRGFDKIIDETGPGKTTIAAYKVMFSKENHTDNEGNQVIYNNIILPYFVLYNMDLMVGRENAKLSTNETSLLLTKKWEGIELSIIGGDMFSGNWANSSKYQGVIDYSNNEQYHFDHNLTFYKNGLNPLFIKPMGASKVNDSIDANTITGYLIDSGSITGRKIDSAPLDYLIDANTITGYLIDSGSITGRKIGSDPLDYLIDASKIADSIDASQITDYLMNQKNVDILAPTTPVSAATSIEPSQVFFNSIALTLGIALINYLAILD